jgi:hypothetical protein
VNTITPHQSDSSDRSLPPAWPIAIALIAGVLLATGCNSRAHSEVYQQRMASEIRVLEDQLYDADYQNRVLRDRLQKYNDQVKSSRIPTPDEVGISPHSHRHLPVPSADLIDPSPMAIDPGVPVPTPDPSTDGLGDDSWDTGTPRIDALDAGLENEAPKSDSVDSDSFDIDEFDPSMFDAGEPVDPEQIPLPEPDSDNFKSKLEAPKPLADPKKKPARKPEFERLPPPAGISPPGKNDTKIDPIIPGEILPPAGDSGDENPPGQILLPNSTQTPTGVPEELRIHPMLSVGHRDGQKLDGATVVVTALDRLGRSLDLNDFEVDAELSVVVLDPDREPDQARLGRWDFSRKEVAAMISADKNGGLEIPVRWKETTPTSDKVIVHIRLRGDDQEMRTQSKLDLRPRTAASTWTPRSE